MAPLINILSSNLLALTGQISEWINAQESNLYMKFNIRVLSTKKKMYSANLDSRLLFNT